MIKKLRRRFVCINMAIVTGMLLVIFCLFIYFTSANLESSSDAMLQHLAQDTLNSGAGEQNIALPYFTLTFNARGEYLAAGRTQFDIGNKLFIEKLLRDVSEIGQTTGYLPQYGLKFTITTTQTIQIIAFLDISSHETTISALVKISLLVGVAALAVFTFISILLARWSVNPVDKAWKQQKQFISDASHELKTPLSVIMSNGELANEEHPSQYTQNILTGSQQMRQLVENLLELARADNGQIRKSFEVFDYSEAVSASTLPFEPVFFENDMLLECHIEAGIFVRGSAFHLKQLTDILLDNAKKYSAKGIVELSLSRQGRNQCTLTVSNPGTPIPQQELGRIFERFYRSDTARTNTGSFGLGLSIAQHIAGEHGGRIWAQSNATGNCFTVVLPCIPQ